MAACSRPGADYNADMSANDLLEQVRSLPLRERRKFLLGIRELEEGLAAGKTAPRKKPIRWPDAAARRRKFFGARVLPNLVLLARTPFAPAAELGAGIPCCGAVGGAS
jgi:hypothetical protein